MVLMKDLKDFKEYTDDNNIMVIPQIAISTKYDIAKASFKLRKFDIA